MKKIILAVAVAAVATMAVVSSASAGVSRYQDEQTGALTVTLAAPYNYVHTYAITSVDPCGGSSFTGVSTDANVNGIHETITGTLLAGQLKFKSTYDNSTYSWNYDGPLAGGTAQDSNGLSFGVTATFDRAHTWANHGEYVAAQGGGSDAAHSCIGMPIH